MHMERPFYLKYKLRAVIALTVLIMVVLLHSMTGKQRVTELQHSVASIYNDRLMPATYIFEITDHLYQKKLLLEHKNAGSDGYAQHNTMIAGLVKSYDGTYLTNEERQHWAQFKVNLEAYNRYEAENTTQAMTPAQEQYFYKAIHSLHALASIQAGEGKKLNNSSLSILQGSDTIAEMEFYVMLILGLCVVVLISIPEKVADQEDRSFSLN